MSVLHVDSDVDAKLSASNLRTLHSILLRAFTEPEHPDQVITEKLAFVQTIDDEREVVHTRPTTTREQVHLLSNYYFNEVGAPGAVNWDDHSNHVQFWASVLKQLRRDTDAFAAEKDTSTVVMAYCSFKQHGTPLPSNYPSQMDLHPQTTERRAPSPSGLTDAGAHLHLSPVAASRPRQAAAAAAAASAPMLFDTPEAPAVAPTVLDDPVKEARLAGAPQLYFTIRSANLKADAAKYKNFVQPIKATLVAMRAQSIAFDNMPILFRGGTYKPLASELTPEGERQRFTVAAKLASDVEAQRARLISALDKFVQLYNKAIDEAAYHWEYKETRKAKVLANETQKMRKREEDAARAAAIIGRNYLAHERNMLMQQHLAGGAPLPDREEEEFAMDEDAL
jgi:hypothetical protein